jgi:hypothetical protein
MPIDDIVFDPSRFILEVVATAPGTIVAINLDGSSAFSFTQQAETVTIITS